MNWAEIKEFNFTYAIPGGAWLKDSTGDCQWVPYTQIEKKLGREFWESSIRKQGMLTGCWVNV